MANPYLACFTVAAGTINIGLAANEAYIAMSAGDKIKMIEKEIVEIHSLGESTKECERAIRTSITDAKYKVSRFYKMKKSNMNELKQNQGMTEGSI